MTKFQRAALPALLCSLLGACATTPRDEIKVKEQAPAEIAKPLASEVIGLSENDTIQVPFGDNMFVSAALQNSDPLPNKTIRSFSVSNATLYDLLQIVFIGTGIPYSVDAEHQGANILKRAVSAQNISGSLTKVLDVFSRSMGFYYQYTDGVLHITQDRQYIAKIPPINDIFESLPAMLKTLGATDVFLDKTARAVTYRATKSVQEKTDAYLKWLKDNKRLIVYETYIAEVVLDDSTSTGIQWNKLSWTGTAGKAPVNINLSNAAVAATGSLGVGVAFTGAHFALDVLASFLKTQGTVNQISRIPMMLIAGGETSFRNGSTDYYVSSIGSQTVAANGQVVQGQSQLSPLNTGINVKLRGNIYDSTVFTEVDMVMNTLIGFKPFPAGQGVMQQAPMTTDRALSTSVRSRSGDTIVLAGINYEKYSTTISGLPTGNSVALPTANNKVAQRSELVIVMRPRIINFEQPKLVPVEPVKTEEIENPEVSVTPAKAKRARAKQ